MPDEISAYTLFIGKLCEAAKTQKRVTAKPPVKPVENEKYAMRCFLLRLGFIDKEYAAERKIFLANLAGNGSFKSGKRREQGGPVAARAVFDGGPDTDVAAAETSGHTGGSAEVRSDAGEIPSDALAAALADAKLIYSVNMLFEGGAESGGGNE